MESLGRFGGDASENLIRMPVAFTDDLYYWLRETAHRENTRMAVLVRQAVREYRDRLDLQLRLPIVETGSTDHGVSSAADR